MRMTEICGSCRNSRRAVERLVWEVFPSYRVYVMRDCARPFCIRSSVEVQKEKTMLCDVSAFCCEGERQFSVQVWTYLLVPIGCSSKSETKALIFVGSGSPLNSHGDPEGEEAPEYVMPGL